MSRAKFEERLESALTDLAVLAATRNTDPGTAESFCVSYLLPLLDIANAAVTVAIPTMRGFRSELKSILLYDSNVGTHEVFSSAEAVDFGPEDNTDEYLDAATVPIPLNAAGAAALAGSSRVLLNTAAGSDPTGDRDAMDIETDQAGFSLVFTAAGSTGITDVLVTVRYYL